MLQHKPYRGPDFDKPAPCREIQREVRRKLAQRLRERNEANHEK